MTDNLWLIESPVQMIEGETVAYSIDWQGANSISSVSAIVYLNGSDITSTAMDASPSHTVSGNVITLHALTAGSSDGGEEYVVVVSATVDTNTEKRKFMVQIVKDEEPQ